MNQIPLDTKGKERATDDALFLERLEIVFKRSLADLQAFAEREECSFDDVRRRIAEWHCKYLFEASSGASQVSVQDRMHSILRSTSQNLESLEGIADLHSFFLVVNPHDPADEGFLGGTLLGREFWRGYRNCGVVGARAFKAHCVKALETQNRHTVAPYPPDSSLVQKKGPASELKKEVYAAVRNALRAASGNRTAEMKWTNHARLDTFGVTLVGWPTGVPMQNPSTLSVAQNTQVLEGLNNGTMYFMRLGETPVHDMPATPAPGSADYSQVHEDPGAFDDSADISWAYQEQGESSPSQSDLRATAQTPAAIYPSQTLISASDDSAEALRMLPSSTFGSEEPPNTSRKRRREETYIRR
ncbi:hypothetical protein OBBRIDRAFT_140424 [Obba rivulosa]|uniref:Uncharacterized protein n=1 Tax=Obba rivulosa TaxID=1052685 RepID=A0A8E2J4B7_9APHY|nr:hypothetical protein OBBRIDRAFT_140424 [Obba rivulosa]